MNAPLVEESAVRARLNEAIIQWIHLHRVAQGSNLD